MKFNFNLKDWNFNNIETILTEASIKVLIWRDFEFCRETFFFSLLIFLLHGFPFHLIRLPWFVFTTIDTICDSCNRHLENELNWWDSLPQLFSSYTFQANLSVSKKHKYWELTSHVLAKKVQNPAASVVHKNLFEITLLYWSVYRNIVQTPYTTLRNQLSTNYLTAKAIFYPSKKRFLTSKWFILFV